MSIPHEDQPLVRCAWLMPPEGPTWEATYQTMELPLGVALHGEARGCCVRIGEWPADPLRRTSPPKSWGDQIRRLYLVGEHGPELIQPPDEDDPGVS